MLAIDYIIFFALLALIALIVTPTRKVSETEPEPQPELSETEAIIQALENGQIAEWHDMPF